MTSIKATKRDVKTDLSKLREEGKLPAVFYGPKEESTPITVGAIEFLKVWREVGESSVIDLKEGDDSHQVLIQDVDVDPLTGFARHADFYVIEKGKKVEVATPLEFVGESPAEKAGDVIIKVMHELEIEATPANLPHQIEVDISILAKVGDQIHAKDIKLPEGVKLMVDGEEVVILVQEAKEEEIEGPAEAPDLSSIVVEGEKKEDGDEGEAEGDK